MSYKIIPFSEIVDISQTKAFFQNLLTTTWLRPERALMDAYMLSVFNHFIETKEGQRTLDWGCTDGSLSFVLFGGEFNFSYDDYVEVEWQKRSTEISAGINVDFFDVQKELLINPVAKPAARNFSHGISWKESHISKASRFNIHGSLLSQGFEEKIPYPEDYFNSVLASNLFWIKPKSLLRKVISDIVSVTVQGGKILSIFPKKDAPEPLSHQLKGADENWIKMLDRGIGANLLQNAISLEEANELFDSCGLKIKTVVEFCPSLVSTVYQIGFRPMFPVFMNMYEKVKMASPEKFIELKKHWINTVSDFMLPLCENDWMTNMKMPYTWYFFELEKAL